jgi:hypothetical protein
MLKRAPGRRNGSDNARLPERSEPVVGLTRQELAGRVERLRPWFHAIELPHGVWTKRESAGTEPADHPAGRRQSVYKLSQARLGRFDVGRPR